MTSYGTKFTETEILLAIMYGDADTYERLLKELTDVELKGLLNGSQRLTFAAHNERNERIAAAKFGSQVEPV